MVFGSAHSSEPLIMCYYQGCFARHEQRVIGAGLQLTAADTAQSSLPERAHAPPRQTTCCHSGTLDRSAPSARFPSDQCLKSHHVSCKCIGVSAGSYIGLRAAHQVEQKLHEDTSNSSSGLPGIVQVGCKLPATLLPTMSLAPIIMSTIRAGYLPLPKSHN